MDDGILEIKIPVFFERIKNQNILIAFIENMKEWDKVNNPHKSDLRGNQYSEESISALNILNSLDTTEGIALMKQIEKDTGTDLIEEVIMAKIADDRIRIKYARKHK